MSDYICHYNCSYRTNSGFCGYTGGYESCQYRKIALNRTNKRRTVYRDVVYNAIERERIMSLMGEMPDRYQSGFHDGLKRALEILNGLQDVWDGET